MPLLNLAWKQNFTWSGTAKSIREQALKALRNPQEMGANEKELLKKISDEESYKKLFRNAFREASPTMDQIGVALEQFVISLTSMDSKFDRAVRGGDPLSQKEKRGFDLFFTEYDPRQKLYGADCFHCHGGPFFSDFRAHDNGLKKDPLTILPRKYLIMIRQLLHQVFEISNLLLPTCMMEDSNHWMKF